MVLGKVAVISASLGDFDSQQQHSPQTIECDYYHFSDMNFPPRLNSMTPRLQARIVKMFSWQLVPDYDYYLWIDSSCRLALADSVAWFINKLGDADIAVFKHPHRNTVQEEADYLKERIELERSGKKQKYILPRYGGEDLEGQMEAVEPDQELYATTAFIYRNNSKLRHALKDWWYHTSRYHSIDQLSLPFVLFENDCKVNVIPDNYLKCEYLEYVRNQ